ISCSGKDDLGTFEPLWPASFLISTSLRVPTATPKSSLVPFPKEHSICISTLILCGHFFLTRYSKNKFILQEMPNDFKDFCVTAGWHTLFLGCNECCTWRRCYLR